MKYIFIILIVMISFVYFALDKKQPSICQLKNDNIITIGDSIANGFGVDENESFAFVVAKLLGKNPIKSGINGETTQGLLYRIDSTLKDTKSIAGIIISIGGNDFLRQINRNITENNLDKIISISKKYTNCIVLLGVPSDIKDSIIGKVSHIYHKISKKYNIILESKSMPEILKNHTMKVDQIHPNKTGHNIIAEQIVKKIKNYK